jgi:hypothetical protein
MVDLATPAKEFIEALAALNRTIEAYYEAAVAIGRESGNPTERGLDARQVRRRIQEQVVAALSTRTSVLQFDGAPGARRFVAANPLPGLA